MNEKQFEALIKAYKKSVKATGKERPLTPDEYSSVGKNLDNIPSDYKSKFDLAHGGDYSKFEKLPLLLRNFLGASEIVQFHNTCGINPSLDDQKVRDYLISKDTNPAFRAGITALKNSSDAAERSFANAADRFLSNSMMKKTLMPPSEEDVQRFTTRVGAEKAPAELEQNLARQRVMAKTFLMAQIGKYEILKTGKTKESLDEQLSETLAHGGRTNFILPNGNDSQRVFDAYLGENGGKAAGVSKRLAATHYASRRELDSNGAIVSESEEEKPAFFKLHKIMSSQYGMNIAAGGIGAEGPDQKAIAGRGESGHAYMRMESGDEKHCGSLLFGIEGCEPGTTNALGHVHDFRAKSAKQSAFLAGKGAVGKKLGGRQIDLSGVSAQELAGILSTFDKKYAELQKGANTPEGRDKLAAINDMLMGKHMETEKLLGMFNELGMGGNEITEAVNKARQGVVSKAIPKDMTEEQFKQSIRSMYNPEDACALAKARFERSGKSLTLAAGAVKELIFTHQTRSNWFKFWHPLQNRDEKATIKSLMGKLSTEKGFAPKDIVAQMAGDNNTFGLNWGADLSNEAAHVKFASENKAMFKPAESTLTEAIKEACKGSYSKINFDTVEREQGQEMKDISNEYLPEALSSSKANIKIDAQRENIIVEAAKGEELKNNVSVRVEETLNKNKGLYP